MIQNTQIVIRKARFLGISMTVLTLMVSIPCLSVRAALIGTETVLDSARGRQARDHLKQLFARADIREALIARGIDPMEAQRRIDALTDDEAIRIADKMDNLPAGGNTFLLIGAIILGAVVIWYVIILLAVQATDN